MMRVQVQCAKLDMVFMLFCMLYEGIFECVEKIKKSSQILKMIVDLKMYVNLKTVHKFKNVHEFGKIVHEV